MENKKTFLLLFSVGISFSLTAQLTPEYNAFRDGDELIKQQVQYKHPGDAGENVIWDFSRLEIQHTDYKVRYESGDEEDAIIRNYLNKIPESKNAFPDNFIRVTEHNTLYFYLLTPDSLFLLGYENPVIYMEYESPVAVMSYPFHYKEMLLSAYKGSGKYSLQEDLTIQGKILTEADASGTIILPDKDTLNNVIRIKTVQTIHQTKEKEGEEKVYSTEFTRFQWFASGYRYPVFETLLSCNPGETGKKDLFRMSFFYPPHYQEFLEHDPENQLLLENIFIEQKLKNSPDKEENDPEVSFSFHCHPNPVETDLILEYILRETCGIRGEITDTQGKELFSFSFGKTTPGIYRESLDLRKLMKGSYILTLYAGEEMMNQIIIKK